MHSLRRRARRRSRFVLAGTGALAASLFVIRRRAANRRASDGLDAEGNWSQVTRPEPTLREARSMR